MKQVEELSPNKKFLLTEDDGRFIQIVCVALIAVDFLFIQSYLSLGKLDSYEQTALYSFTIAIPFLVGFAVITKPVIIVESRSFWKKLMVMLLFCAAVFVNLYGIWNVFFHFSSDIGNAFILSIVAAILFFSTFFMLPFTQSPVDKNEITTHHEKSNET